MIQGLRHTSLYSKHIELGAQMTEFGGWEMPIHYKAGIFQEHLITRQEAGLFDLGHMGCLTIKGPQAISFIQFVTTNNAAVLQVGQSQYTILADEQGGAIDDAFLYRFFENSYILVVNAANHEKVLKHLISTAETFDQVIVDDISRDFTLLSLQGPLSEQILTAVIGDKNLPAAHRNNLSVVSNTTDNLLVARTGYTGEPLGFELFVSDRMTTSLWEELTARGASPIGLGARDTLRLEAGLPLYGYELGYTFEGKKVPVFAILQARFVVNFSAEKGIFIGKSALEHQFRDLKSQRKGSQGPWPHLPQRIRMIQLLDKGIARSRAPVFRGNQKVGHVTSGTMVPYWLAHREGTAIARSSQYKRRAIAMALVDGHIEDLEIVKINIQGKSARAIVMPRLLRKDVPPFSQAVLPEMLKVKSITP